MTLSLQVIICKLQASFMSYIICIVILVDYKIWVCLINRIISKMHTHVFHISQIRLFIRNSSQPGKSFFMHKNSQRMSASNQNIYSKIKFETVYKKRLTYVFLSNIDFYWINIVYFSCQIYAFTLTQSLRLNYDCSNHAFLHLVA